MNKLIISHLVFSHENLLPHPIIYRDDGDVFVFMTISDDQQIEDAIMMVGTLDECFESIIAYTTALNVEVNQVDINLQLDINSLEITTFTIHNSILSCWQSWLFDCIDYALNCTSCTKLFQKHID